VAKKFAPLVKEHKKGGFSTRRNRVKLSRQHMSKSWLSSKR